MKKRFTYNKLYFNIIRLRVANRTPDTALQILPNDCWRLGKRDIFLLLFFLGVFTFSSAQSPIVVTTDSMMIGDNNQLRFRAELPTDAKVISIDLTPLDSIEGINQKSLTIDEEAADPVALEIRNYGKWTADANRIIKNPEWTVQSSGQTQVLTNILTYTIWEEGVYFIPALDIVYEMQGRKRNTRTNPIPLVVSSPLTNVPEVAGDSLQVAPIKDIIVEPLKFQDFIWYIVGLLCLLALGIGAYILMRKRQNQPEPEKVVIKRPAHVIALDKLDQLKTKKLWQQGEVKAYQSELTYIVREYLENRYEINALESTTDEILQQVKKIGLTEETQENMRETLQMADMVKFAKAKPPVDVNDRLMQYAESFVLKTKKVIIEEPLNPEGE